MGASYTREITVLKSVLNNQEFTVLTIVPTPEGPDSASILRDSYCMGTPWGHLPNITDVFH